MNAEADREGGEGPEGAHQFLLVAELREIVIVAGFPSSPPSQSSPSGHGCRPYRAVRERAPR